MKKLLGILMLGLSIFACSGPPASSNPSVEATPAQTVIAPVEGEESDAGLKPIIGKQLPENWKDTFFFENAGGQEGQWVLGNDFELHLEKEPAELKIFSKSMMTPHAFFKVEASGTESRIEVVFLEYLKGNGWDEFEEGDVLFALEEVDGGVKTHWEGLKPLYGEVGLEGFGR